MKKYFLAFLLPFFFLEIDGQVVSYSRAKEKAISFFQLAETQKNGLKSASLVKVDSFRTYTIKSASLLKSADLADEPAFYIFNRTDKPGFVIVSAEEKIRDIIAWSDQNAICQINPEQKALLDQYVQQIAVSKTLQVSSPVTGSTDLLSVAPLLGNIQWNQAPDPYNTLCPFDAATGRTCPAGCVGTAMAQVIYYYRFPTMGNGSSTYTNDYGKVTVDYGSTTYDYDAMAPQPVPGVKNAEIAKLLFHCGVSLETDYGPYGSSAYVGQISAALSNYFKYKSSSVKYMSSYTIDKWKALINSEIDNKRPVIYGALDPLDPKIPDDISGGHAFVLDGYNDQDQYHVNWGWGGCSDGYYSLNLLNPDDCGSIYTFSDSHMMITGIEPSSTFDCLLTVDSNNLHFYVTRGSQTIQVSSNSTWTVSDNAPWISVSTASGRDNETLTVETTANDGVSERSGVITITGCDKVITVNVVQDGICSLSLSSDKLSFTELEASTKIKLISSGVWMASTDAGWINVSPAIGNGDDTLKISVTNNVGHVQRSGTITVSGCGTTKVISVSQDGTCTLALSSDSLSFESDPGVKTITLSSSTSWWAKCNASWMTLSASSGNGNGTFTVSVSENQSDVQRTGTITISGCNADRIIPVTQKGLCFLDLATHNAEFEPEAEDKFIYVTSNSQWKAVSENSWITTSPSSGEGNNYLGILVDANPGTSPRSGVVTVTGCNSSQKITVIQQSNCPLSISTNVLDFTYAQGSKSATISSTAAWTVSSDTPWISVSPRTGSKIGTFTISVPENSTSSQRTGIVTITGCYLTKNVTVVQDFCNFTVSDQKLSFPVEGGTQSLKIGSSSSWSASANSKWVTVSPMFSAQSGSTLITVEANSSAKRSAILTVSGCFSGKQIEISQEGVLTPVSSVDKENFKIYPTFTDRYVNVEFPSGGEYTLEIYAASGNKIRTQTHLQPGEVIDLAGLAKGIYLFRIYSNTTILKNEKIVLK